MTEMDWELYWRNHLKIALFRTSELLKFTQTHTHRETHTHIYIFICLFIYLFVYLLICLFIYLFIYLSIYQFIYNGNVGAQFLVWVGPQYITLALGEKIKQDHLVVF